VKQTEVEHPQIEASAHAGPRQSLPPGEDPRLVAALEEYLAAQETGETPDRDRFLARHPEIAPALADCLKGLEFIRTAASQVRQPSADRSVSAGPAAEVFQPEVPLGDYRIVREVGRGGMGVVYEAVQLSLGRRVALKVLPFAAALDPKHLQRFKNEAQAAAQLHHTNIVPVFGVGCDRGVHFYAMQFIEGQTVAAVIREMRRLAGLGEQDAASPTPLPRGEGGETTFPPPRTGKDGRGVAADSTPLAALTTERSATSPSYFRTAAQLGIQAAEALEHAHQLGIAHRDVKPANLLVDVRGNLWVTDFGLAQFHADAGLTQTGDVLGTLRYMSPEQVRARHAMVDHRTDIYSLGVTLYELLTLEPAFATGDRNELAAQIAFEEPRLLRQLNKAVPVELETIILKAMEKDPAERYATAQELADDLRCFLENRTIRAKRPTLVQRARKWSQRHMVLVRAAVAVLFITTVTTSVGLWYVFGAKDRAEKANIKAQAAKNDAVTARNEAEAARKRAEEEKAQAVMEKGRGDAFYIGLGALAEDYLHAFETDQLPRVRRGEPPDQETLEKVLQFYALLVKYPNSCPPVRQAVGNAYRRVGDIQQWLGDSPKAEDAYGRAIKILEELVSEFPDVPRYRYELAGCYNNLGILLVNSDRPRKAEDILRRSLKLYEELRDELSGGAPDRILKVLEPINLARKEKETWDEFVTRRQGQTAKYLNHFRNELAGNHHHLALMYATTGRPQDAEKAYERALTILEKLVDDGCCEPKYGLALACLYENRAGLFQATGRLKEAEQGYQQAQGLLKKLAAGHPQELLYRQCLAMNWDGLGILLEKTGRLPKADEAFEEALKLKRQLVADRPALGYYRYILALSQREHGRRLQAAKRLQEAETAYREAAALLEQLVTDFPQIPKYRHQLARSESVLANLLATTPRLPEAEKLLRQARDRYEKLRADTSLDVRPDLASNQNTLALVLEGTGRAREAQPVYEQAVALWQELVDANPEMASHHSNLGSTLTNLARMLNARREWEQARPLAERAVSQQKVALQLKPEDADYCQLLQEHNLVLAESWLSLSKHEEAARVAAQLARGSRTNSLDGFFAADVLVHCVPLVEHDDRLSPAERRARVREHVDQIQISLREVERQSAENPAAAKALARFLAVYSLPGVSDPERAMTLARQAIDRSPRDGTSYGTLGMALYRAGQWPEAVTALNKAMALRSGDGLDGFFLAMAHWRAGDKDKAALWYERAAAWMEKHQADRRDLRLIRAEAAALLGRSE
jgi:serine/threonine protein kinase/Flp pilus assembly protein TadD